MADVQARFDLYSQTISNSAVSEFDAEPDPVRRFQKYALTITNSEQAAIEALIGKTEVPSNDVDAANTETVRLDSDVVEYFRKSGGDWQHRINNALRASIKKS